MNLTRIRYFVEAARQGSLTVAAQALYTSQPNLSKQIALLEQELGFPLFHRAGRSISLTKAGRYLYEQLAGIPDLVDGAVTYARALSRGECGSLSIGVVEGQDVEKILTARLRSLPGPGFDLERGSFRQLRQGLENGRYDMIVTLAFELEALGEIRHEVLLRQQGAIFISRSNPLSEKADLGLEDLREEPFIVIAPEESPGGYELVFRQCAQVGYTPRVAKQVNNTENMIMQVETGVGVALLDTNTRLGHSDLVRCVPLPGSPASDVVAVWRRDSENPVVSRLAELLRVGGPEERV